MSTLILAMVLNSIYHYKKIGNNEFIHYESENATSFVVILCAVAIEYALGATLPYCAGFLVVSPAVRWIVHDLCLNWLRGLAWDYLGTRSKLDKFLRKFKNKTGLHFIFVKAALLGASVWVWWAVKSFFQ